MRRRGGWAYGVLPTAVAATLWSPVLLAQQPPPETWSASQLPPPLLPPPPPPSPAAVHLELPVLEVRDNFVHGGRWPSMGQSLWVASDAYELMHFGLGRAFGVENNSHPVLGRFGILAADVVTLALPGFLAWQHEEWHRAVLSQYGFNSFDDVYKFDIFASLIAVSHVRDEDLIALKRDHPADQVRLSSAGIEGNYELATNLERLQFLYPDGPTHTFALWLLMIGNNGYLETCAGSDSDKETDDMNRREGSNVEIRDFTGLDCDGWVYDLFRPDEPYTARGMHPSGVGIDRYRKWSQLTAAEQHFLSLQYKLSFLNALDPHLIGLHRFQAMVGGRPLFWNAAVRHQQTAAGHQLALAIALQRDWWNAFVTASAHMSEHLTLPGLDVQTMGVPLAVGGVPLNVSARASAWLQPSALRYDATGSTAGALASVRVAWEPRATLQPYVELEGKSAGWVAGNVHLGPQFTARVGLVSVWQMHPMH